MSNNPFVQNSASASSSAATTASRWITNPKQLPIFVINELLLWLKEGVATVRNMSDTNTWTAMALEGATASITVADTYVTLANLTGSGYFFSCTSPTHSAAATPTIRLTVDGTVYTFAPSTTVAAVSRLFIGAATNGAPTAVNTGTFGESLILLPNAYPDAGVSARIGGINGRPTSMGIAAETSVLNYDLPCLRFESSLKIEAKCSLLSATANHKACGALYRLDL